MKVYKPMLLKVGGIWLVTKCAFGHTPRHWIQKAQQWAIAANHKERTNGTESQ